MLDENQVKRLLKACERATTKNNDKTILGWCQALRLVLEKNTYPIRKDALDGE